MKKMLRTGFSLMEMVVVIIIIGILVAGIIKVTSATKGAKVTTLNSNISNLATAAIQWADQENSGSYEDISLSKLEEDNILGNDWGTDGKSKNPFAGGIKIKSGFNGNGFIIIADKIPEKICKKYNSKKYKVPAADDWECSDGTLKAYYGGTKDENK